MNKPDKMKFETSNLTAENVAKIAALFPGAVVEGKVNIELLRAMLGEDVFTDEAYEFTWVGKRAAIAEAGRPIRKTLRPCPEESKDWDTTENLYIEGDNLDVLKLLQESYLGKVKMVYIDPPYNTGNDFIYRDDFAQSREEYNEEAGVYDEDGDRLFRNTETNGRFHSDWCSMIYPRLVLARNLLRDDGVIFISIDNGEIAQLRKICDEVFGESNFVAEIAYQGLDTVKNDAKYFSDNHEYVTVYAKCKDMLVVKGQKRTEEHNKVYKNYDKDPKGDYLLTPLHAKSGNANNKYEYTFSNGVKFSPPQGTYHRFSRSSLADMEVKGQIYFDAGVPQKKTYLCEVSDYVKLTTFWDYKLAGSTRQSNKEVAELVGKGMFDNPKSIKLLRLLVDAVTSNNDLVLDFFSGSATTAHAVMQLNAEDGGKRKFIMVQLPEVCAEGTEAAKAGYTNICEIGKERIRRAGDKIKADSPLVTDDLDVGFRVLKLDDTNMNDVYYAAGDYTQDSLFSMVSNFKEDRNDMDLLFGCLLDWGLPLSMPHTHEEIEGLTVHTYNGGDLIACFEARVPENVVREIASRKPLRAVFRDSGFTSSPEKINVFEIFKLLAPNTTVRVI
jgi:adenine-specific DNA-methyltransferase